MRDSQTNLNVERLILLTSVVLTCKQFAGVSSNSIFDILDTNEGTASDDFSEPGDTYNLSEPGDTYNLSESGDTYNLSEPGDTYNLSEPGDTYNLSEPGERPASCDPVDSESRSARYLVYNPNGGVFKLILGWAIPVEVPMSVVWGHNFQFQYKPVENATQLAYPVRPRPKLSRDTVYGLLKDTMNLYGLDGKACVLRTLCEFAGSRLSTESLYAHLLNTILTPPESADSPYYKAWSQGKTGSNCESHYASCELNLLQLMST